jgi:hypothetical protein
MMVFKSMKIWLMVMPKPEFLFEVTPKTPLIATDTFAAQLITYGGYTYAEDYTCENQLKENKIVIMGDSSYDNSKIIESDHWNHAYIEIKVPVLFSKSNNLKLVFILKSEETTNSVQIFLNNKLVKQEALKARLKQEVTIEVKDPPSLFKILLRPVYPYPRPFSFFGMKALLVSTIIIIDYLGNYE